MDVERKKLSRLGVYGMAYKESTLLLVTQKNGPFAGKYDFPGGALEFGECPEDTLRREFSEETGMSFDKMELLDNVSGVMEIYKEGEPIWFHQIGMIYFVTGLYPHEAMTPDALEFGWIDQNILTAENTSPLLWQVLRGNI